MAEVAQRTGAAIVLVRHLTKDTSKSALHRGGGSIGITGAARSVLLVARDPDNEGRSIIAQSKQNLAPKNNRCPAYRLTTDELNGCAHISWDGELVMTADELLSAHGGNGTRQAKAAEWLEDFLANGARASKEVEDNAKAAGHAWATVKRASEDLGVDKYKKTGAGQNAVWFWRLRADGDRAA